MVTYEALFSFCLVIIGVIALFQSKKIAAFPVKKKRLFFSYFLSG